jgi:hypothetical protein
MNKSKAIIILSILIIVTVGAAVLLFLSLSSNLEGMEINDPRNDVLLSFGSGYPQAVDITGAALEISQEQANLTIRTNEQNINIGERENIIWEAILILENQTDVVKTFDLQATLNSTGLFCSAQDVEDGTTKNCNITLQQNKLLISMTFSELAEFEQVEWNVISSYEETMSGALAANAFDFAPDQGTHLTIVQSQTEVP